MTGAPAANRQYRLLTPITYGRIVTAAGYSLTARRMTHYTTEDKPEWTN